MNEFEEALWEHFPEHTPTFDEFVRQTEFSHYDVRKTFGGWTEFLDSMHENKYNYKYEYEDFQNDITEACVKSGRPKETFRMKDQEAHGTIPPRSFISRFGTWDKARSLIKFDKSAVEAAESRNINQSTGSPEHLF